MGLIIDDDFLTSNFPSSSNWNLSLLGRKSVKNSQAYYQLEDKLVRIQKRINKKMTDQNRFMILSYFYQLIVILDQNFTQTRPLTASLNSPLVDDLISYINQHFSENLTAFSISQHFKTS